MSFGRTCHAASSNGTVTNRLSHRYCSPSGRLRPLLFNILKYFACVGRLPQLRRRARNVANSVLRLHQLNCSSHILSEDNSFHPHSTGFYHCAILVHYAAALRSVTKFCCALLIFCRSRSALTACCARLAFVCRLATRCWSGVSGLIGLAGWISDRRIGYLCEAIIVNGELASNLVGAKNPQSISSKLGHHAASGKNNLGT